MGYGGDWDGASGLMETEVAAPGSSSTPKTKKANAKTRQKKKAPGKGKGQRVVKWSKEERLWLWECICWVRCDKALLEGVQGQGVVIVGVSTLFRYSFFLFSLH